jgi:phosphoglycerate dehydrogenase-like enzyme
VSAARPLRLWVAPQADWLREPVAGAVTAGGGECVDVGAAEAVVWNFGTPQDLERTLADAPHVSWVQLVAAGVEAFADLFHDGRTWTSAKRAFAEPVAEHGLALLLAGLRDLPRRARERRWGEKSGRTLFDSRVVIVGGGGIADALLRLLAPFRAHVTVVRRSPRAMDGAEQVVSPQRLDAAVAGVDAVFLAAALTAETRGMIGREQLRAMGPRCWLVNVARGALVRTDDLIDALRSGSIGGAALDVVDPEPLPAGSPLWSFDNCLITPHTANPRETERKALARLLEANIRARREGRPLLGVVDPAAGY